MEKIKITTAQNVELEYNLADLPTRIYATLIDYCVLAGYAILFFWGFDKLPILRGALSSVFLLFLAFLPMMLYHLLCEVFFNGQTLGKSIMKIKVVRLDGTAPRLPNYILRWLFRLLDITISSGSIAIIAIIFSERRQRLGDMAAGTTVVYTHHAHELDDTVFVPVDNYAQITFPQVSQLSSRDMMIINEVLLHAQQTDDIQVVYDLAEKVMQTLNIQTDMYAVTFIDTIIRDYNAWHNNSQSTDNNQY